jgi:hypothetical protein
LTISSSSLLLLESSVKSDSFFESYLLVADMLGLDLSLNYSTIVLPFVVYPFAWSGHFFIEKNKPAAFKNPLWAKASDWVMLKDIIIGKIKF